MKSRLTAALAVAAVAIAASSALPGTASAQYYPPSSGYRWGPPPPRDYGPPPGYFDDEDDAPPVRQIPNNRSRVYGPTVIQANPQNGPQYDQGPAPRPPSAIGGASQPGPAAAAPSAAPTVAGLPPEDQPETGEPKQLPPQFQRQLVDYPTREPAGTLVIDTPNTYLYLVLGDGKAMRYGIGVGREGFTWNGAERVSRMAEWPDWHPPAEMIERQPYLPRFMAGGDGNPLGARALYLGKTLYRIHGTNQPSTIGTFVSSGCIRLTNRDIEDLYSRVQVGTRVVVLPAKPPETASAEGQSSQGQAPQGQASQGQLPQAQAQQGLPPLGGASSGAGPVSVSGPNSIPASPLPPAR
jgi:lipoprotein-anchoring transpeptidase ErfK/SrfK